MSMNGQFTQFEQLPARASDAATAAAETRALAEVQAQLVSAKRYPRNEHASTIRIVATCKRYGMAAEAMYAYPRAGGMIRGPSIRLAEVLAQQWGNLSFGVVELSRDGNTSKMQAYCWDLETNTKAERTFEVRHERKAGDAVKALTDPRDVYEHLANQASRRLRECIFQVIPRDVRELAVATVEETLRVGPVDADGKPKLTRDQRVGILTRSFDSLGVSVEDLERYVGRPAKQWAAADLVELQDIGKAIQNDPRQRERFFGTTATRPSDFASQFAPEQPAAEPAAPPMQSDGGGLADAVPEVEPEAEQPAPVELAVPEQPDSLHNAGLKPGTLKALNVAGLHLADDVLAFVGDCKTDAKCIQVLAKLDGIGRSGAIAALAFARDFREAYEPGGEE